NPSRSTTPASSLKSARMIPADARLSNPRRKFFVRISSACTAPGTGSGLAGQAGQRLAVFVGGLLADLGRYLRRRCLLVPAGGFQPVAHELLVEARRIAAFGIAVGRPEAAGIRGQRLVHQGQGAVVVQTELELGVGDDDAARGGVLDGGAVQGDGGVAHLG